MRQISFSFKSHNYFHALIEILHYRLSTLLSLLTVWSESVAKSLIILKSSVEITTDRNRLKCHSCFVLIKIGFHPFQNNLLTVWKVEELEDSDCESFKTLVSLTNHNEDPESWISFENIPKTNNKHLTTVCQAQAYTTSWQTNFIT